MAPFTEFSTPTAGNLYRFKGDGTYGRYTITTTYADSHPFCQIYQRCLTLLVIFWGIAESTRSSSLPLAEPERDAGDCDKLQPE